MEAEALEAFSVPLELELLLGREEAERSYWEMDVALEAGALFPHLVCAGDAQVLFPPSSDL